MTSHSNIPTEHHAPSPHHSSITYVDIAPSTTSTDPGRGFGKKLKALAREILSNLKTPHQHSFAGKCRYNPTASLQGTSKPVSRPPVDELNTFTPDQGVVECGVRVPSKNVRFAQQGCKKQVKKGTSGSIPAHRSPLARVHGHWEEDSWMEDGGWVVCWGTDWVMLRSGQIVEF